MLTALLATFIFRRWLMGVVVFICTASKIKIKIKIKIFRECKAFGLSSPFYGCGMDGVYTKGRWFLMPKPHTHSNTLSVNHPHTGHKQYDTGSTHSVVNLTAPVKSL